MNELAEALEIPLHFEGSGRGSEEWWGARKLERAAARRQLALEPEKCEDTRHDANWSGKLAGDPIRCPTCHGRGWLYKPETVERLTEAIWHETVERLTEAIWQVSPKYQHVITEALVQRFVVAVLDEIRLLDQEAPR